MTREEVIKILEILHQRMDYPTKEALAIAICHLSQPSLPPNLDEAEEKYAYNNWEDNDYHTGASEGLPFDAIGHTKKCFRAGAEWMAGQFQKIDGSLVDWYETNGVDYCHGIRANESFEVPEGFYIRKK